MVKLYSIVIILILFNIGCGNPRYKYKKQRILQTSYEGDSVVLKDFIFCNNVVGPWDRIKDVSHSMNEDSVIKIFENSLFKLNKSFKILTSRTNLCNQEFQRRWLKKLEKDEMSKIIESIADKDVLHLFPVVTFTNGYISGMYFTSSGGVGGSRYLMQNILNIDVLIIKNDKIIYQRSGVKLGTQYPAYDVMDIQHTLTQKDWDELVALVMKDYVERIRE